MSSACLQVGDIAGFLSPLLAIQTGNLQYCVMELAGDWLTVRWENESKTMQSSVFLRAELFSSYQCDGEHVFGIKYTLLLKTLQAFSPSCAGNLEIRYPGPNGELLLETKETMGENICLYARIMPIDVDLPADASSCLEEPTSSFLIAGAIMKEAVEDLEPSSHHVEVIVNGNPTEISLTSHGLVHVKVDLPLDELSEFHCDGSISYSYHGQDLKSAVVKVPAIGADGNNTLCKVVIDSNGLMKVTHMLSANFQGGGIVGGQIMQSTGPSIQSQVPDTTQKFTTIQSTIAPLKEEVDEEGDV